MDDKDFIIITGDPDIDHPSFGAAVIKRVLEREGYSVGVIAQPAYRDVEAFRANGRPRLSYLVTGGSVDSMVANYTAAKRKRRTDALAPGGRTGLRPDRACIVYTNMCKQAYHGVSVILGGLEASLRRLAHYDYWDDKVRRSILLDSKADLIIYGMGELAVCEVAAALADGFKARDITWVDGTVYRAKGADALPADAVVLPAYSELQDYDKYSKSFLIQQDNSEHIAAKPLAEPYDDDLYVVQSIPARPLTTEELDSVYELPYSYDANPAYAAAGESIPALHEIKFSAAHVRGCYGGCAFCAITHHQGRIPTARSEASVVNETERMTKLPGFKGFIHDIGGPTANIIGPACAKQLAKGTCKRKWCLWPEPCPQLIPRQGEYLSLLKAVSEVPGVKKVFVRSGIRYDLALSDRKAGAAFIKELAAHHVSGQLKVAPEHAAPATLAAMRKPGIEAYERFETAFNDADAEAIEAAAGKGEKRNPQYLLPYYIASHPGCGLTEAEYLRVYIKSHGGFFPEQIQDFYPTPGTLASCMYYTGKDPYSGEDVYIPRTTEERREQRKLLTQDNIRG